MNVMETEWWTMALPPEWWAEAEEDSILVGDRDGVGCIEISTLHREQGDFTAEEVRGIAEDEASGPAEWKAASLGEFSGVSAPFSEDGMAIREWYASYGGLLLFVTYSCEEENRGMDDAAVLEILDTLMVANLSE
jgi:hypothetical protein